MTKPTKLDWARLAAYIDGEGAILINRSFWANKGWQKIWLRLNVTNTDPRLPQWCKKTFGVGNVNLSDRRRKPQHRQSFRWDVSSRQAETILRGCLPWFLIKKEEAEIALAFQETLGGPGRIVSQETWEKRELLRQQLHARKRITPLYDSSLARRVLPRKRGPKPHGDQISQTIQ